MVYVPLSLVRAGVRVWLVSLELSDGDNTDPSPNVVVANHPLKFVVSKHWGRNKFSVVQGSAQNFP